MAKFKSKLNLESRHRLEEVIPLKTPFLIYLDPSSACNFKCEFCPSPFSTKEDYIKQTFNFELYKKVIDDLKEFDDNIKMLRFHKIGEPLLNKNIVNMVKYAKDSGKVNNIDMTTNGSLLTRDISEGLVNAGMTQINISIEGISSEQYKKYVHYDIDIDNLIENIKYLYSIKGDLEIIIKIPSNYLSEDDKQSFLDMFSQYCDRIFIENLSSIWPNFNIMEKSKIINIDETKDQYNMGLKNYKVCTWPFYAICVNSSGTVSPCALDWQEKLIVGDAKKQSLKEIWNSDKLNELRIRFLKKEVENIDVCSTCGNLKYCQVDNIDDYAEEILKRML